MAVLPLFVPLSLLAPLAGRVTAPVGARLPMAIGLTRAAGVTLLARAQEGSGYLTLVPAMLLWGVGLGLLTPAAVVAAAIGAVSPQRAGLASAVNNTARQAGGAIGIAAFGALAGQPTGPNFIAGFHAAALIGAGLLVAAVIPTLLLVPANGLR